MVSRGKDQDLEARDPRRQCCLGAARRKTLARRDHDHCHDLHCRPGSTHRHGGRVDGEGHGEQYNFAFRKN